MIGPFIIFWPCYIKCAHEMVIFEEPGKMAFIECAWGRVDCLIATQFDIPTYKVTVDTKTKIGEKKMPYHRETVNVI